MNELIGNVNVFRVKVLDLLKKNNRQGGGDGGKDRGISLASFIFLSLFLFD